VAVDPGHLYWVNYGDGTVWRANLDGTNPHAIIGGQYRPGWVAVGSWVPLPRFLYWANNADGTITQANLDASNPHPLVSGQSGVAGVAVDTFHLYWANNGGPVGVDGSIWAANLDGSNPKAIVTGQNNPVQVAVDPSHLYWTNGDSIWQANLDGTNPQTLATGQDDPWGVAVSPVVGSVEGGVRTRALGHRGRAGTDAGPREWCRGPRGIPRPVRGARATPAEAGPGAGRIATTQAVHSHIPPPFRQEERLPQPGPARVPGPPGLERRARHGQRQWRCLRCDDRGAVDVLEERIPVG
jgi:hypothetical protein